ncbi:MAG: Hpt domain-containing protein, partial [Gemmatimonadales bacterium]
MNTKRYADLFRAEARDRLEEMNTSLLAIERGEGIERVAELFRAVHTVKGMSAAMGYTSVRDISHALEALLELMRRQAIALNPSVIDALFVAVDALEAAIAAVSADESATTDVSEVVAMLDAISAQPDAEPDMSAMQTMEWPAIQVAEPAPAREEIPAPAPQSGQRAISTRSALSPFPPAARREKSQRSIRVDAERLDTLMTLIGELVIAR